jgi:SAM-dependent methyltransferase
MKHQIASRKQQSKKILSILNDFLEVRNIREFRCLEVGCGTGEISAFFADYVNKIWGVEIDRSIILNGQMIAHDNLAFSQSDGSNLPFSTSTFDLVLFPQVYEHTTQQKKVIDEIYRTLKPGGICFFSGPNRFQLIEPHYFLPFLSWLPHNIASLYLRITKRGKIYDIYPRNFWYLKKLTEKFKRIDYTHKLINNPEIFGISERIPSIIAKIFPTSLTKFLEPFYPNYNWILIKPKKHL